MARSKEFNEEEALDKAMEIFWKQGYEKTSIQDLVDQMGIHRRSLYDTFGDKHSLFVQTLERYESLIASQIRKQITEEMTTVESIRKIFELAVLTIKHPLGEALSEYTASSNIFLMDSTVVISSVI